MIGGLALNYWDYILAVETSGEFGGGVCQGEERGHDVHGNHGTVPDLAGGGDAGD